MARSLAAKGAEIVQSTPGRKPVKSQPRVVSEGRYRITARPDGGLVIAWFPDSDGGGVITLPPMIARLIERANAGEQITPAMVLRAMRG